MTYQPNIGDECLYIYKGPHGYAVNPELLPAKVLGLTKCRVKIEVLDWVAPFKTTVRAESLKPKLIKRECECGEQYFIQHGNDRFRKDGKRIFSNPDDTTSCMFRCRNCGQPVHKSVPGAEFEA